MCFGGNLGVTFVISKYIDGDLVSIFFGLLKMYGWTYLFS